MLALDKLSRTPIYEQIINSIIREITTGLLSEGSPLPSVRELSEQLGVNPNTVQRSYGELDRKGYIVTLASRGAYVAEGAKSKIRNEGIEKISGLCNIAYELYMSGVTEEEILSAIREKLHNGGENS